MIWNKQTCLESYFTFSWLQYSVHFSFFFFYFSVALKPTQTANDGRWEHWTANSCRHPIFPGLLLCLLEQTRLPKPTQTSIPNSVCPVLCCKLLLQGVSDCCRSGHGPDVQTSPRGYISSERTLHAPRPIWQGNLFHIGCWPPFAHHLSVAPPACAITH